MNIMKPMVMYVILPAIVLFSSKTHAYEHNHDCTKNPIYCQIVANKPTIKKAYAFKLSNIIAKKTQKYKIDHEIFTAILAQESMYNVSAKNCTTGLHEVVVTDNQGIVDLDKSPAYIKKQVCTDFGIGQIFYKTADSYDFDFVKLTTDVDYSVEAAAIVLEHFKNKYSKKESNWWTRYNASNKEAREKYKDLVERFINAD